MPAGGPEPGSGDDAGAVSAPGRGPANLGDRAAVGFVVMVLQTLGVRVIRLGGSLVLAWLLFPDDFALFGLSVTLHQFISVLKNAGLRDILIHRQARMRKWVNPAIWISGALGLAGGLVMVAAAIPLSLFYQREEIVMLVLVLAAATPFQSLMQVPMAMLHAELRFKTAANVESVNNIMLMLLTVYFAWAGLGPASFVLPILVMAITKTAFLWWLIKPKMLPRPQFNRWRYFVGDSTRLIGADIARTISYQADYVVLGRAFPGSAVIGHYFYAFQISSQSVMLFGRNINIVLFPALASINDNPERHHRAFGLAMRMLAIVGIPLCILQAAVAEPAILAALPERFHASIPYVVLLSIGMAPRLMIPPCSAMLRSQGRFSTFARLTWGFAFAVAALATLAAVVSDAMGVAAAVSAAFVISGILFVVVTLWGTESPLRRTMRIFTAPAVLSAAAGAVAWLVGRLLPDETVVWNLTRVVVVVVVMAAVYTPSILFFEREATIEIYRRIMRLVRRRGGKRGKAAGEPVVLTDQTSDPGAPG